MEFQKRFPYDYLITTLQRLPVAGQEPAAAIYEGPIGRSEVFDEELAILIHDSGVTARDLGFRIVLIEVDVGEYPAIGIPSSNMCFRPGNWKFLTSSASAFYDQLAAHLGFGVLNLRLVGP